MSQYNETIRNQVLSISTAGNNTVISAPGAGKRICIDHINLVPNAAVTVILQDGATALSGAYSLTQNQGFVLENSMHFEQGLITCSDNIAFVINLSGAIQTSGFLKYRILNE